MSVRVDTSPLISGAVVIGNTGLGVTGAVIRATTATGDNGPGYLYNDWDNSGDDDKEFRGFILTAPSDGIFFANEDGSFSLIGAADGTYNLIYRLYVDGVDMGTASSTITIGEGGPVVVTSGLSLTDVIYQVLEGYGYTGTLNEKLLKFYLNDGATTYVLQDAEKQFLSSQGYTSGTLQDRWMAFLTVLGYTSGSLQDRKYRYWYDQ